MALNLLKDGGPLFPLICLAGIAALAIAMMPISSWVQWAGLLAVPALAAYNGKRGKLKLKHLFYIYYPAHLVVIWAISQVV